MRLSQPCPVAAAVSAVSAILSVTFSTASAAAPESVSAASTNVDVSLSCVDSVVPFADFFGEAFLVFVDVEAGVVMSVFFSSSDAACVWCQHRLLFAIDKSADFTHLRLPQPTTFAATELDEPLTPPGCLRFPLLLAVLHQPQLSRSQHTSNSLRLNNLEVVTRHNPLFSRRKSRVLSIEQAHDFFVIFSKTPSYQRKFARL